MEASWALLRSDFFQVVEGFQLHILGFRATVDSVFAGKQLSDKGG